MSSSSSSVPGPVVIILRVDLFGRSSKRSPADLNPDNDPWYLAKDVKATLYEYEKMSATDQMRGIGRLLRTLQTDPIAPPADEEEDVLQVSTSATKAAFAVNQTLLHSLEDLKSDIEVGSVKDDASSEESEKEDDEGFTTASAPSAPKFPAVKNKDKAVVIRKVKESIFDKTDWSRLVLSAVAAAKAAGDASLSPRKKKRKQMSVTEGASFFLI